MSQTKTLRRAGLAVAAVAGAVLTPSTTTAAATAAPVAPAQSAYDGHLEEANAWALDALNAPAAWETTRGEGVTIAVVDTGIGEHPFFEDKDVLPGRSVLPDQEDAWYDVAGDPDDPDDKRGHGTGVAAMALTVAPEATILPVRRNRGNEDAFERRGGLSEEDAEAIRWAVDNGADVIVMAWGVCCSEPGEDAFMAMQYAIDHDVVLAAAAGNEPEHEIGWHHPAAMPGVVTVTGFDEEVGRWDGGTVGPEADVAGPAGYSLAWPNPQSNRLREDECTLCDEDTFEAPALYHAAGGTSSAVGWVGGVVALIRSAHPDLDAGNVVQRLIRTADDRGAEGHDDEFGFGVPDAAAAVTADVEPVEEHPLGYPLGIPGASGETASGEPAPGTSATAGGDAGNGSDLVPLVVVTVVAAATAAGAWALLRRRAARPAARAGHGGRVAAPLGTGLVVALAVALVAAGGTYLVADAAVDTSASGGTDESPPGGDDAADDGAEAPLDDAEAGAEGELAADGNAAAIAAQAWQDAHTVGDLEAFRSLTCENPWYRVAINMRKLEDPAYVRPGFAILHEYDQDWQADDYRLERASDGKAWVAAGDLSIGVGPTYEIALVREGGEWKVCDFWHTGPGWHGVPEWEERQPRDGTDDAPIDT